MVDMSRITDVEIVLSAVYIALAYALIEAATTRKTGIALTAEQLGQVQQP